MVPGNYNLSVGYSDNKYDAVKTNALSSPKKWVLDRDEIDLMDESRQNYILSGKISNDL
jgi:hypothetical protein